MHKVLLCVFLLLAVVTATHFRFGTIKWWTTKQSTKTVNFVVNGAWRNDYPWNPSIANTATGVVINPGDLTYGDGSSATLLCMKTTYDLSENWLQAVFGDGYGIPFTTSNYPSTADSNKKNRWPASPSPFTHVYKSFTSYTVGHMNSARISSLQNAADKDWQILSTVVLVDSPNPMGSPVANSLPIITIPYGQAAYSYRLLATPYLGGSQTDKLRFRMSTCAESIPDYTSYTVCHPPTLYVNSSTTGDGVMIIDTRNMVKGGLYTTQQIITEVATGATIPIDYILYVVEATTVCAPECSNGGASCTSDGGCTGCGGSTTTVPGSCTASSPRMITKSHLTLDAFQGAPFTDSGVRPTKYTPEDGTTLSLAIGQFVSIPFIAHDAILNDPAKVVIMSRTAIPNGASMTTQNGCLNPGVNCNCNVKAGTVNNCNYPQVMNFTWTPTEADAGSYTICVGVKNFDSTASIPGGQHCINLLVSAPDCLNGGTYNPTDGTCSCVPGFDNTTKCADCNSGYYGPECTACSCVPGQGTCSDGVYGDGSCVCAPGYTGSTCSVPLVATCSPTASNTILLAPTSASAPINPVAVSVALRALAGPVSQTYTVKNVATITSYIMFMFDITGSPTEYAFSNTEFTTTFANKFATFQASPGGSNGYYSLATMTSNAYSLPASFANNLPAARWNIAPGAASGPVVISPLIQSAVSDVQLGNWPATAFKIMLFFSQKENTPTNFAALRYTLLDKGIYPVFILKSTASAAAVASYNNLVASLGFGLVRNTLQATSDNWVSVASDAILAARSAVSAFALDDNLTPGLLTVPSGVQNCALGSSVSFSVAIEAKSNFASNLLTPLPAPRVAFPGWGTSPITVALNRQPLAAGSDFSVNEDATKTFVVSASDPDNNLLNIRFTVLPTHGALTSGGSAVTTSGLYAVSAGTASFVYKPAQDYNGADSFTFVSNDGCADSAPVTVAITVNPVNDAPTCDDFAITLTEAGATPTGTSIVWDTHIRDIDNAVTDLSVNVLQTPPARFGSLSGSNPRDRMFTPVSYANGGTSFTYQVFDGALYSTTCTVTVTINPVNNPPTLVLSTYSASSSSTDGIVPRVKLTISDRDFGPVSLEWANDLVDDSTFTASGTYQLQNSDGSVTELISGAAGTSTKFVCNEATSPYDYNAWMRTCDFYLAHKVAASASGSRTVDFVADDSTATDTKTLTIKAVSSPPTLFYKAGDNTYDNDNFVNGGYTWTSPFANQPKQNGGAYLYKLRATDLQSSVVLEMMVNTLPPSSAGTLELETAPGTYSAITTGSYYTVSATGPGYGDTDNTYYNFRFTPAAGFYGDVQYSVTWQDEAGETVTGSVDFPVTPVNQAPVLQDPTERSINEDATTPVAITFSATDAETIADNLVLILNTVVPSTKGTLCLSQTCTSTDVTAGQQITGASNWVLYYWPGPANAFGDHYASFDVSVRDTGITGAVGTDGDPITTAPKTQFINVIPQDDAPTTSDVTVWTPTAIAVKITFPANDIDSDSPSDVTDSIAVLQIATPLQGAFFTDAGCTTPATQVGTNIVSDASKVLYYQSFNRSFSYDPEDYPGDATPAAAPNLETISFTIRENTPGRNLVSAPATLNIKVSYVESPPEYVGKLEHTILEDSVLDLFISTIIDQKYDVTDPSEVNVFLKGFPAKGTLRIHDMPLLASNVSSTGNVNGLNLSTIVTDGGFDRMLYQPLPNEFGDHYTTVTLVVCNKGNGTVPLCSADIVITINVLPVNDPPVVHLMQAIPVVGDEDTPVLVRWNATDVDSNCTDLTGVIASPPSRGSLFACVEDDAGVCTSVGDPIVDGKVPNSKTPAMWQVWFKPLPNEYSILYDSFLVQAFDGFDLSLSVLVSIRINPVNDPPIINCTSPHKTVVNKTAVVTDIIVHDPDAIKAIYARFHLTTGVGQLGFDPAAFQETVTPKRTIPAPCVIDAANTTIECTALERTINTYLGRGLTYLSNQVEVAEVEIYVSDLGGGSDTSNPANLEPSSFLNVSASMKIEVSEENVVATTNNDAITYAGIGAAIAGVLAAIAAGIFIRKKLASTPDDYFAAFDNDAGNDVIDNPLYSNPYTEGTNALYSAPDL